jgi:predicted nucleotidyltransferase
VPRTSEILHFADLIASLMVSAARAESPERLAEIKDELEEALVDALSLIAHDALADRPTALPVELLARTLEEETHRERQRPGRSIA